MTNELLDIKDFVSVLEAVLIILVSFIGASVHEYIFGGVDKGFLKNPNVISTVVVVFIISYSINPLIVSFNPRFILLPPLILGLLGNELTKRMGTIKGSSSLIEYILGFFSIKNKVDKHDGLDELEAKSKSTPSEPKSEIKEDIISDADLEKIPEFKKEEEKKDNKVKEKQEESNETVIDIDKRLDIILHNIERAKKSLNKKDMVINNSNFNLDPFRDHYEIVKIDIALLKNGIKDMDKIAITSALKLAEVLKKEEELDELFNSIKED